MSSCQIDRRRFLAGTAAATAASAASGQSRKSVLLLVSDDHSPIAGCYGNSVIRTPNLDRLAENGVRFDNAFCTTASCSASRSVLLTGMHNHANGQFGHAHMPHNLHTYRSIESLPKLMRAGGGATGVIGKLHVQPEEIYSFDFDYSSTGPELGSERDVWEMGRSARDFFDRAADKPFFLLVGFGDPHRYGTDGRSFANEASYRRVSRRVYRPDEVEVPAFLPDLPEVRAELADYYQAVDRMDQGVGFVLDALRESGREKDTLVIYLSDHGMPFPGAKATVYDTGLRSPLIVSSPEVQRRGVANQALVSWTDILPTAVEWAGLAMPSYETHGRSFLSVLNQESPEGWDSVFYAHTLHEIVNYYPVRGIRTRRYKYWHVLFPELEMPLPTDLFGSRTWEAIRRGRVERMGLRSTHAVLRHDAEELYDVEADPLETRNLAADPGLDSVLSDLRSRVADFRTQTQDPWMRYLEKDQFRPLEA